MNFILEEGDNLIGRSFSCKIRLTSTSLIDDIQAVLTVEKDGVCSIECLSEKYEMYKELKGG